MGTRGLVFIRCNGRYYIYYNRWDSYDDGLGQAIVNKIPADPEKYQVWLENMRETYSRLSQQYENDLLCVSPKLCRPGEMLSPSERYSKSFLTLDDRLCAPPLQSLLLTGDCNPSDIEWTYTIDLDRELLAIDSAVCFSLPRLPHHEKWYSYLTLDRHWRRALEKNTPSDLIGNAVHKILVDRRLGDKYSSLHVKIGSPRVLDSFNSSTSRKALLIRNIVAICSKYRDFIDRTYKEWASTSFAFREIAFAILSTAAGEVAFKSARELNGSYANEGFFLIPNREHLDGEQTPLPRFLHECHSPGADPGSAPQSNPFWLGNVLVYLAPRINHSSVEKAAIAAVVDSGLNQGLTSFHALVFSILDFVLIHVEKGKTGDVLITRTPLMNLLYFDDNTSRYINGPHSRDLRPIGWNRREQANDSGCRYSDVDLDSDKVNTDITCTTTLINFFDAVTDQHLVGTRSHILPDEILTTIMELSDCQTYLSLARVSACCRNLYYHKFRLNDDYAIVNQGYEPQSTTTTFTLEELSSSCRILSSLRTVNRNRTRRNKAKENEAEIRLSAIIGMADPGRTSILDEWSFAFSNITPKQLPYDEAPQQHPYAEADEEEELPMRGAYHYGPDSRRLFTLPDHLYLGSLKNAFRRYIMSILQGQHTAMYHAEIPVRIQGPQYPCLIPQGCRVLRMDRFDCSGMLMFLRSRHDESAEGWEKAVEYALQKLEEKGKEKEYTLDEMKGCPVIVAFGRRLKLFYYVNKRTEPPPAVTTSLPHCVEIAERCMESEPRRRLVNIIPGNEPDEPISLDDSESREKFETWIRTLCCTLPAADWDPFLAKMIPLDKGDR